MGILPTSSRKSTFKATIAIQRLGSHSGGWLQLNATVQEAEQLLNTTYYIYQNVQTGESRAACDEYSVSSSIQHHIDFVMPTIQFSLQAQQGATILRSVAAFEEDQSALAAAASSEIQTFK